jgi:hypothetical protein
MREITGRSAGNVAVNQPVDFVTSRSICTHGLSHAPRRKAAYVHGGDGGRAIQLRSLIRELRNLWCSSRSAAGLFRQSCLGTEPAAMGAVVEQETASNCAAWECASAAASTYRS